MRSLTRLIAGELQRLVRYKILPVSLATSVLWIALFWFLSPKEAVEIAPLLMLVDAAVMSILLLGASHHLEKQEGTIRTMMVMPISPAQILAAKTAASMLLALESAAVTSAALFFIHRVTYNYLALLAVVAVTVAAHAASHLITAAVSGEYEIAMAAAGFLYLVALAAVLFKWAVYPKFKDNAARG